MASFQLSEFLPYRMAILSASMSALIAREYENRFGLTMNQWRIIAIIAEHKEVTANEISTLTLMDKMTVSRAVKKLSSRNLIRRNLSVDDNRKTIIKLSKIGHSIHNDVLPLAQNYENQLYSILSDEERINLTDMMKRLQDQIESIENA